MVEKVVKSKGIRLKKQFCMEGQRFIVLLYKNKLIKLTLKLLNLYAFLDGEP